MRNPILVTTRLDFRSLRGGSWDDPRKESRVPYRGLYEFPHFEEYILPGDAVFGFRVFRSLK